MSALYMEIPGVQGYILPETVLTIKERRKKFCSDGCSVRTSTHKHVWGSSENEDGTRWASTSFSIRNSQANSKPIAQLFSNKRSLLTCCDIYCSKGKPAWADLLQLEGSVWGNLRKKEEISTNNPTKQCSAGRPIVVIGRKDCGHDFVFQHGIFWELLCGSDY